MKVPSLEDMIRQEITSNNGEYTCLVCCRPLIKHYLVEDLRFPTTDMIILCDPLNPNWRFKSTASLAKMSDTLSLMLTEQWDKPRWIRSGAEVIWIT